MIELERVSKSYGKSRVKAVDDLTLTVPAGSIYGFLGPNGAGKTTTIKMIVGILSPDSGRIRIQGLDTQEKALACKAVTAYVPDNPDIYEKLSGREYLAFIGDVYGIGSGERNERAGSWLETFELDRVINDPIQSYSHGMRQKIVLTAALVVKPQVLVLDEPMVGLDPKSARVLKDALRSHCRDGGTVFFSTHIMEVAEHLCDRLGIIHHGRLLAQGTLEELRSLASGNRTLEDIFLELTRQ
jgi:ABC-2 type transport system ATP-binding protein